MRVPSLQPKPSDSTYDRRQCAVARCASAVAVIYASTNGPWPRDEVPLCERHWGQLCDAQEAQS